MDDSTLMRMMDRFADSRHQFEPLARTLAVRFHVLGERFAPNELHCEVRLRTEAGVGGARLVDLRDTRVLQATEGLRFQLKASDEVGTSQAGVDHFKSDDAMWTVLLRLIHRSHSSSAQKAYWTKATVSASSRDSRDIREHFFGGGDDEPADGLAGGFVEAQQRFHFVADSSRGVVLCIIRFPLGDRTISQLVKE